MRETGIALAAAIAGAVIGGVVAVTITIMTLLSDVRNDIAENRVNAERNRADIERLVEIHAPEHEE